MAFSYDPEFATAMTAFEELMASAKPAPTGDITTRRENLERITSVLLNTLPMPNDVSMQDFDVAASDGAKLLK